MGNALGAGAPNDCDGLGGHAVGVGSELGLCVVLALVMRCLGGFDVGRINAVYILLGRQYDGPRPRRES